MITKEQQEARYEEFCKDPYKVNKYQKPGIYCIKINGIIVYVGKSRNMLHRLAEHSLEIEEGYLPKKTHKYKVLNDAYVREDCRIDFDVIGEVQSEEQKQIDSDLAYWEAIYINTLKPQLNYQMPKIGQPGWVANPEAKYITLAQILDPRTETFIF